MGMVDISKFGSIDSSNALNYSNFKALNNDNLTDEDVSIFDTATSSDTQSVDALNEQLNAVEAKQGFFSNAWNDVKEFVGIGTSVEKCDEAIEKYKNGEITYEEASAVIDEFALKQDSSLNLFSNIVTGVTAITAATAAGAAIVASGGTATPLVLAAVGAGTGAVTKATYKFTDRATNDVEGDATDTKQIIKDGLSGAVTGAIGAATMGTGSAAETLGASVAKSAAKSAKTGFITGAVSGSSNYLIDTTFDDNKDFDTKEFLATTATSAAVGTAVGTIMGSANGAMRYTGLIKNGGMVGAVTDNAGQKVVDETGKYAVANASKEAIVANSLCSTEYKLVNNAIRSVAA